MALNLEHHRQPVANIHHPGVLTGTLNYPLSFGGELLQQSPGAFVAAMLTPHQGKNAQLSEGRHSSKELKDALVFILGQPLFQGGFKVNFWLLHRF